MKIEVKYINPVVWRYDVNYYFVWSFRGKSNRASGECHAYRHVTLDRLEEFVNGIQEIANDYK